MSQDTPSDGILWNIFRFRDPSDGITIPRCEWPVLHLALRGSVVSLSGIREAEREEMYRKITLMNGRVEKSLTLEVVYDSWNNIPFKQSLIKRRF